MRGVFRRVFGSVGILISRFFNFGISLKVVLLLLLVTFFGTRYYTRNQVIQSVGGTDDYEEAMRYIEIKDIIEDRRG